jgi:hypothetical protein
VNIYRDTIQPQTALQKVINFFFGKTVSAAATNKIFETNGTYFNDLTVKPNSKYEYTLTSTNTSGSESSGINVDVQTKSAPKPTVENPTASEKSSGYLVKWDNPTTGTVRIFVNGNIYADAQASNQQFLIPSESIVKDVMGKPLVKVMAITTDGIEGDQQDVQSSNLIDMVKNIFTASDILTSSFGLIAILAPFILLGLVITFFKPLKKLIVDAINKRKQRGA